MKDLRKTKTLSTRQTCWQLFSVFAAMVQRIRLSWGIITLTGGTDRAEKDGRTSMESSVAKCEHPVSQCLEKARLTGEMKDGRCQLHLFHGLLKDRRLLSAAHEQGGLDYF